MYWTRLWCWMKFQQVDGHLQVQHKLATKSWEQSTPFLVVWQRMLFQSWQVVRLMSKILFTIFQAETTAESPPPPPPPPLQPLHPPRSAHHHPPPTPVSPPPSLHLISSVVMARDVFHCTVSSYCRLAHKCAWECKHEYLIISNIRNSFGLLNVQPKLHTVTLLTTQIHSIIEIKE